MDYEYFDELFTKFVRGINRREFIFSHKMPNGDDLEVKRWFMFKRPDLLVSMTAITMSDIDDHSYRYQPKVTTSTR